MLAGIDTGKERLSAFLFWPAQRGIEGCKVAGLGGSIAAGFTHDEYPRSDGPVQKWPAWSE